MTPQQRTEPAPRTPNPEAVRRIVAHLWGEDEVNLRAAVESFGNGWTLVSKAEAARGAERPVPRTAAAHVFSLPQGFAYHTPDCEITAEDNCTCDIYARLAAIEAEAAEQSVPLDVPRWRVEVDDESAYIVETAEDGADYVIASGLEWQQAKTLVSAHHRRLVPQPSERSEPARPADTALLGCDIDGDETLGDWALRLADERIEGIVEPHELAHAKHRRAELRAALAAQPSAEQPGEEER